MDSDSDNIEEEYSEVEEKIKLERMIRQMESKFECIWFDSIKPYIKCQGTGYPLGALTDSSAFITFMIDHSPAYQACMERLSELD